MVGVPRSKGCRICVQRRVRCDQTRPICNNCKKGNRPCPGYGNDMKFQDEGPKLRERYQKQAASHESSDEETVSDPSTQSWEITISSRTSRNPSNQLENSTWVTPESNEWVDISTTAFEPSETTETESCIETFDTIVETGAGLPQGFLQEFVQGASNHDYAVPGLDTPFWIQTLNSPKMEQYQLLAHFIDIMSPQGHSAAPAFRYHGRWLSRLPHMIDEQPLLDTAIRAVTLAYLGIHSSSEAVKREAGPSYGRALRLLNSALLSPDEGMTSTTLSATILLSFYEMFASSDEASWVRHAGGAGTLMRIRGPERHRYGFDREIFLAYRHAIIIEAFEQDKACFLNEPAWRSLAADIHEDIRASGLVGSGSEADHIFFDFSEEFFMEMAQVPGMCCDARHLPELAKIGGGQFPDIKADVTRRAKEQRMAMKSIQARFAAVLRIQGSHTVSKIVPDPVIPIRYSYFNIFVASSHTGYRTILMIINGVLCELDPENAALYTMENREVALECCRSVDFMETSSFLGPFFVVLALRLSWNWLEQRAEKLWVVNRLRLIGERTMSFAKGGLPMRQIDAGAQVPRTPRVHQAVEDLAFLEQNRDKSTALRRNPVNI